jgi:iron complex outermembrane recepter protein
MKSKNSKSLWVGCVLFIAIFLFSNHSNAQETPVQKTDSTAIKETATKNLPEKEKSKSLDEVNVYAKKQQYLEVGADKTVVAVKNNAMLSSGTTLEAIKKIPGVIAAPNGSLSLNGKGVTIYIDGSPSTLTGDDLQNYLNSLPANAVEKIELIYNPGAAYEANARGSIVNIITNSKRMKGVNATFNVNYNFNKYQKPSPQIALNGKENNTSWQALAGYNYIDSERRNNNGQTFTNYFGGSSRLQQNNFNFNTNREFYFRVGTNHKLTERSNLLFNYNGSFSNDRIIFDGQTIATGIDYVTSGITKNKNNNHELSLQYKTKLDTIGRTLSITSFTNIFEKNPRTLADALDNQTSSPSFNNGSLNFDLNNYYLKYDFAIPFKKIDLSINTGGKYNILKVINNGIYDTSTSLSEIKFDYEENNLAFYAEVSKKIKKFNITAGLRYENFDVSRKTNINEPIKFKNNNIFPSINANYELMKSVNVSGSYSKKIEQPGYFAMDPNNNSNFNQYNTSQGNLFLNPTFFDNYEFKISAFEFVNLGVNYTSSKNNNLFVFNAKPDELVSNATAQQFKKFTTFTSYISFPIPLDYFLKSKEEFQSRMGDMEKMNYIFANIVYIKSGIEGYTFPYPNRPIWQYAFQSQFILPWNIKNSMSYFILPNGNWQIYRITKPIQQFDISFTRDFLNKKLKVGLHVFDVFNANQINAQIGGENLLTDFYEKQDTRTFRVSLTYNFGNLKAEKENIQIETQKAKKGGGIF